MKIVALLFLLAVALVCRASTLDSLPKLLDASLPIYPVEERKAALKAIVSVLILVDEKGQATVQRVMTSSSYRFATIAQEKAKTWRFRPARRNDAPSAAQIEYLMFFDPEKPTEISGPLYE